MFGGILVGIKKKTEKYFQIILRVIFGKNPWKNSSGKFIEYFVENTRKISEFQEFQKISWRNFE